MKKTSYIARRLNWGWLLLSLLMVIVMLCTAVGSSSPSAGLVHAQPELLQMAAQTATPDCQYHCADDRQFRWDGKARSRRLGGKVTAHLSIIRALAADIPAEGSLAVGFQPGCTLGEP